MHVQTTPSTPALAKGNNFTGMLQSLERRSGHAAVEATVAASPPRLRDALRLGEILTGGWYPVAWYIDLNTALRVALNVGHDFGRLLARDSTIHDFSTLHRRLVGTRGAESVLSQADRLMDRYWKGGTVRCEILRPGAARLHFAGWNGFDRAIWQDLAGGVEGVLHLCRAQDLQAAVVRGGGDSDSHMDLELRWT